jgi:hypothetical protein
VRHTPKTHKGSREIPLSLLVFVSVLFLDRAADSCCSENHCLEGKPLLIAPHHIGCVQHGLL